MKTALVFPPQWYPSQPYLALPTLKAYLETKGHEVDQFDFNVESYDLFLSRNYLEHCVDKIQSRLIKPVKSYEDREAEPVHRQILEDTSYLETILSEINDAKQVLRDEERFFQFEEYKNAYTTLKVAMQLISYAHYPSKIDLDSFFMKGNPEENLQGILEATQDSIKNPFLELYKNNLLKKLDLDRYGLVGIAIIHAGQVIPGLTLARILRTHYPHLHITIGGSVFARHQDILQDKKALFEEMFHSIVLFEGEDPLDQLLKQLKNKQPLDTVPNLIYIKNGEVVRNASSKALPYDQLACPNFDDLPLNKYLMPYPVLPYMASRGCYWGKCTFCTHSFIYDSHYRKENEERVAEELDYLGKKYKTKFFTFSDEAISPNAFDRMSKAIPVSYTHLTLPTKA